MTDVFRKKYKTLSEETKNRMDLMKDKAQEIYDLFESHNLGSFDTRCMSLAKTNLEQSIMWYIKSIT